MPSGMTLWPGSEERACVVEVDVELSGSVARGARDHPRHAHDAAKRTAELSDGTNDLFVSDVIRTGELPAWFLAEHLVDTPLIRA